MLASHPVERTSELVQVSVDPYRMVSMVARCRAVVLLTEQSSWEQILQLEHLGPLHGEHAGPLQLDDLGLHGVPDGLGSSSWPGQMTKGVQAVGDLLAGHAGDVRGGDGGGRRPGSYDDITG